DLNLILGQGGFGLGEGGLERPWIDGEEEVALVDVLALLDVDAHELAADLGLDRDDRIRLDAADGPDLQRDRLPLDRCDRHRHGRPPLLLRLLGLRLVARTGGEREARRQQCEAENKRTRRRGQCWSSGDRWDTATGRAR